MSKVHCYTSITFSYLDRARVLAETVRKFHPEWKIWLLLSDEPPPGFKFDLTQENFDEVMLISQLQIPELPRWMFGHDIVELCTAVKGKMMAYLLENGAESVVYLDPDTALFAPLVDVEEMLKTNSVILTPHISTPETSLEGISDNEIGSLKHGVYNLGFVAVRNCVEGIRFSHWWRDRLLAFCHDDVPNGLFTDQRWCDLVPALFDNVGILRDTGYNTASWNLSNRPISFKRNGDIYAAGAKLRFFHFTKVNSVGEAMLERYSYGRTEVFELLRWYRERLSSHKADGLPADWWAYGSFENGAKINRSQRLAWRNQADVRARFVDPYSSAPGGYQDWCAEHIPN